ncbi:SLC13 family permease [Bacillus cytotoxicus]
MIIFSIVDLHTAFTSHIQWETITLLIGMMILVHITSQSGVFEYVAIKAKKSDRRKAHSHFIIFIPINCRRFRIFR